MAVSPLRVDPFIAMSPSAMTVKPVPVKSSKKSRSISEEGLAIVLIGSVTVVTSAGTGSRAGVGV